jgi:hypothetical protein
MEQRKKDIILNLYINGMTESEITRKLRVPIKYVQELITEQLIKEIKENKKRCICCKEVKALTCFGKRVRKRIPGEIGYTRECSSCKYRKMKEKIDFNIDKEKVFKLKLSQIKQSCKTKGIKYDLTPEYCIDLYDKHKEKCFYTDKSFILVIDAKQKRKEGNLSFDRIDPTKGYEKGNIVNPLESCIDVGFGLERLEMFVNGKTISKEETLKETIHKIIDSGYKPSNIKQGYVLRKLLRELWKLGSNLDHEYFNEEVIRQKKIEDTYERLKNKHSDKSKEWWFDTHGINIDEVAPQDRSIE